MRYLGISDINSFIKNLLTIGMADEGISWGQRIEIILASICGGIYFKITTGSTLKGIVFGYGVYLWIFLFGMMLQIMSWLFNWLHAMPVDDEWQLAKWYFIIGLLGFLFVAFRQNKFLFLQLLKDSRPLRIVHFLFSFLTGILIYLNAAEKGLAGKFILTTENILVPVLVVISVFFAAVYSIVANNLEDIEIDKISNPDRPSVLPNINLAAYLRAGNVALLISLVAAYLAGRPVLVCMSIIIGMYYLYSCKPFRLKSIPIASKMVIGINSFFMALMGYTLFGETALTFPKEFIFFYIFPISLAANFIDLKDVKGDVIAGIKTLPVLIGLRNAQWIIAFFTISTYICAYIILHLNQIHIFWTIALLANAFFHIYFLIRKSYVELPVMILHTLSLVGMNAILFYT
jgi:4-hydroxybenzoate polyprenyltransferase